MNTRHLLTVHDLSTEEIQDILNRSQQIKEKADRKKPYLPLAGKTIGLYFEKWSTRTRISFEVGAFQLGGHSLFISTEEIQLNRGETVADTAKVLSRYLDGIVIRTYHQRHLEEWARAASIPVINGLTDLHHPCQAISDLFTILEKRGRLQQLKLAYIGDGNNVAHSLVEGAVLVGMNINLACPKGYEPNEGILERAQQEAKRKNVRIELFKNPKEAVREADILYTDVWTSMGQESEQDERKKVFQDYCINRDLLEATQNKEVLVMHCLPAHRGEEITNEVMEGPFSIILDQAENRLHAQKAILDFFLGGPH
ncbi:MAG TPA: ornithine carbamoyltransferase [Nitrospiria bacterium]